MSSSTCRRAPAVPFVELENVSLRFFLGARHTSLKTALVGGLQRALGAESRAAPPAALWSLQQVSLRLDAGDRLGVVGRNGAGKTTLLRLMARIYKPTHGRVLTAGSVAPVLQLGLGFNPEMTGRENVFFAGAIAGIPRRRVAEKADDIMSFCELERFSETPVKYYSSGMAARLAFTIATELDPDILLLDEVFAVGDRQWTQRAQQRVEELISGVGILVLVSHSLELVRKLCNRAILLEDGRIRADGSVDEVLDVYQGRS